MRIAEVVSIGFALIFLSASVRASEVKVGGVAVQLSPPSGYCELDKSIGHDKELATNTGKIAEGAGTKFFGLFADCEELKKARQTKELITTKIIIQATQLGESNEKNLQATCDDLKSVKISSIQKESQDNVKKNAGGSQLGDQEGLGVLDEVKNEVCYYGLVQNIALGKNNYRLLNIFATALRQRTMFFIYDVRPLDSTSVAATLAHVKSVYADFAKANPN